MSADVPDPDKLKLFSFTLFSKLEGAVTSAMVWLGDSLGLYRALAAADGPLNSTALAERTGLDERWVREWAHNQSAAKLIEWREDGAHGEFSLSAEAKAVMVDPDSPVYALGMFQRFPNTMGLMARLPESFRTGIGHDYDAHGPNGAAGIERSFAPWFNNFLVPVGLPALDGVVPKLEAGAKVADVGCGAGVALERMAQAFPNSQFHGYDISEHALERADQRRAQSGLTNLHFHNARHNPLPTDASFDLVTTFDCIHDMTHPQEMMHDIRKAVKDDGSWLLVDIKGRDTFAENLAKNPMAPLMYGISVFSCMASALSEPGGAGLGTLGLPASKAEAMAREAGFTQFRKLDIDHSVNSFFEIRA